MIPVHRGEAQEAPLALVGHGPLLDWAKSELHPVVTSVETLPASGDLHVVFFATHLPHAPETVERVYFGALDVARAIVTQRNRRTKLTFVITMQPEAALLHGLVKTLSNAHPDLDVSLIELEGPPNRTALTAELRRMTRPRVVRLSKKRCEVPAIDEPSELPPIRQDGAYLITGGVDGLRLANHLATTYSARVMLVGHRGAAPAVGVVVQPADLADPSEMRGAVRSALARFGDLDGVIHAGLEQFRATVYGTYALYSAVAEMPLDFVGLMGTRDAATNAFLDAFAKAHSSDERHVVSMR